MEHEITPEQATRLMGENPGRFFSVTFKRRNDKKKGGKVIAKAGDLRTFKRCRFGVRKDWKTKEGKPTYDRKSRGLCCVWVSEENEGDKYRAFPWGSIVAISIGGKSYKVSP